MTTLLPKSEIQQKKSAERKAEVDEGVKLARQVDSLRRTASTEEVRLAAFRSDVVVQTLEDIKTLLAEKEELDKQIGAARITYAALTAPLDDEWERLDATKAELDGLGLTLQTQALVLEGWTKEIKHKLQELEVDRERIKDEQLRVSTILSETNATLLEAKIALASHTDAAAKTNAAFNTREHQIAQDEIAIRASQATIENRQKEQDKRERELNARERGINDKYATLLRNEQRHGKRGTR